MRRTREAVIVLTLGLAACADPVEPPIRSVPPVVAQRQPATAATYTLTDLGLPPGYLFSYESGLNDNNDIVATLYTQNVSNAGWAHRYQGGWVQMATLPGATNTKVHAINNAGVAVGYSDGTGVGAVKWKANGTIARLKRPTGWDFGEAWDINNSGVIVGHLFPTAGPNEPHAYKWSGTGIVTDLHPTGALRSYAFGINNAGDIVGMVTTALGVTRGYIWRANGTRGQLERPAAFQFARAEDVSDAGLVVGEYYNLPIGYHGVSWNASTATFVRGAVSGNVIDWNNGFLLGASIKGRVVGSFPINGAPDQAATYLGDPELNAPQALPSLGFGGLARKVNACGNILGEAFLPGSSHPALWTIGPCDP